MSNYETERELNGAGDPACEKGGLNAYACAGLVRADGKQGWGWVMRSEAGKCQTKQSGRGEN